MFFVQGRPLRSMHDAFHRSESRLRLHLPGVAERTAPLAETKYQRGFSIKNLSALVSSRILGNPSFFVPSFPNLFTFFRIFLSLLSSLLFSSFLFFSFFFFLFLFFFFFFPFFFLPFPLFFLFFPSFSSFFFPFFSLFFSFSFSIASYGKKPFFLSISPEPLGSFL